MSALDTDAVRLWLKQVRSDDKQARENLLIHFRPKIRIEAQRICRRYLEWGRDDELSIALIAFNESINAYREEFNTHFWPFARVVLRRRLIDYFRASGDRVVTVGDDYLMQETVYEDWDQAEREEEILHFKKLLASFGITFLQVAEAQPRHKETRERLLSVASILAGCPDMMETIYATGNLPKKKLCKEANVTSRMLDRGRIYLIALALLLHSNDLPLLQEYISDLAGKGVKQT